MLLSFGALFGRKRPEPSYPARPLVDGKGQSNVPGIYLIGEVGGTPLVKLGLNQGVETIDALHAELGGSGDGERLDVVIVGAGCAGLGAAMRAQELGLKYVVLESERFAMTIRNMYTGKLLFAEPLASKNASSLWFEECTREELLDNWTAQISKAQLQLHEHEKVTDVSGSKEAFVVETAKGRYEARRVVLAIGKAGNPRKAGVPGESEHAARVMHSLSDPGAYEGKNIFVYGGGDVAAEATLALCEHNQVTMVTIDEALTYPKKRNVDAIMARVDAGQLALSVSSKLVSIGEGSVTYAGPDGEHTLDNDVVFEMIGAELPLRFFDRVGIQLEGSWNVKRWLYFAAVFIGVYSLYALKKFPETPYSWPFNLLIEPQSFFAAVRVLFEVGFAPFAWMFSDAAYADILAVPWFQQGYLYSLAYTIAMGWFGWLAFRRWGGLARDPRYQRWRYLSLIGFQLGFFLIANVIAVQALSIQHAWRAWGLYQPWPLFFNTFHWWDASDPRALLYLFGGAGLVGTFVAIPLASWKHGKRFCTWICGCGGLAETLGDRWRHLAAKGARSRAWEFQGVVILAAAFIVTLVTVGMYETRASNSWASAYSYIVDFWLVAVIPIALYPFFGGKVWCRYWCPLAAWNGLLARWYGRLQIKSNDKCITCTECSRYCQVGVDVMHYAKNQLPFDNRNTACIQCGICIDVCPMDVLSFEVRRPDPKNPGHSALNIVA